MEFRIIIISVACFSCLIPQAVSHILAAKAAAIGSVAAAKGAAAIAAKKAVVGLAAKGAVGLAKGAAMKGAALLAAKGGLIKEAVIKGATILAEGAAAKGAAILAAKGNAIKSLAMYLIHGAASKGAALLSAKAAAIKGHLEAKKAALHGAADLGAAAFRAAGALASVKTNAVHSVLHKTPEVLVHNEPPVVKVLRYLPWWPTVGPAYRTVPAFPAFSMRTSHKHVPVPEVPPQFPGVFADHLSALYKTAVQSAEVQASAAGELASAVNQAKVNSRFPTPTVAVMKDSPRFFHVPLIQKTVE